MLQLSSVHYFKLKYSDQLPEIKKLNDQSILLILLTLLLKETEHLSFFEKNFILQNEKLFGCKTDTMLKILDQNPEVVKHFNFDQSIAELSDQVTNEFKVQLLLVLFDFSISSGKLADKNVVIIKQISDELSLSQELFLKVLSKYKYYNRNYRQKAFADMSAESTSNTLQTALKILGLSNTKDTNLIKKTYRELAIQYHPDKQHFKSPQETNQALERFKAINEAYEIIKDILGIK